MQTCDTLRFDLVRDRQTITDIDDARIFAGSLEDSRAFCRKAAEMNTRALVAAVLAPHDAEDSEFGQRRLAFEDIDDLPVLAFRQVVLRQDFFGYHVCP